MDLKPLDPIRMSDFFSSFRKVSYIQNGRRIDVKFSTLLDMDLYVYQLIALYAASVSQLCAYNVTHKGDLYEETRIVDGPMLTRWKLLAPNIFD